MTESGRSPSDSFVAPQATWEQMAAEAGKMLLNDWGEHAACIVLGSGWSAAAQRWEAGGSDLRSVTTLPGFVGTTVAGHAGTVQSVPFGDKRALVFRGRTHYYESRDPFAVAHAVRVALAVGCRLVVLTNAAGAINPDYGLGQVVLIRDHINLTWVSPFNFRPNLDPSAIYSSRLLAEMKSLLPDTPTGVYAQFIGPQFESPAEIKMAAQAGADLAGMSTAIEALAAAAGGAEVLGMSLVTNAAAGMPGAVLDHKDVLAVGRKSAGAVIDIINDAVVRLLQD
ncbi:purine-nucleoside phosphorylase [Amycolatopsis rifamycinica]|uniref:purine-nucleoside phosphorylase n=1 Tax=Amycolatopsis rifamycinica TaxID=287986 RepID=A0A066UDV5_9PSEU|nr:purine-nucleoside phosphorylase [Amycolatopsis rifamycinica]KDN24052.1 hypothetical protein DV20_01285 [Amycolatopsis rifamycinica]